MATALGRRGETGGALSVQHAVSYLGSVTQRSEAGHAYITWRVETPAQLPGGSESEVGYMHMRGLCDACSCQDPSQSGCRPSLVSGLLYNSEGLRGDSSCNSACDEVFTAFRDPSCPALPGRTLVPTHTLGAGQQGTKLAFNLLAQGPRKNSRAKINPRASCTCNLICLFRSKVTRLSM